MWDPSTYLAHADLRARPFVELVGRIDAPVPTKVVDLGCGPGNLTTLLAKRWPMATIEALDSSTEMVEAARTAGIAAVVGDVATWTPTPDTSIIVCNAVLHWLPNHRDLLRRWVAELAPGSWLAFQVPGNFTAPTHEIPRALAESSAWAGELAGTVLAGKQVVDDPVDYARLLADAGCTVDAWETTYIQSLTGSDPVLSWVTGTVLRPVLQALDEQRWGQFQAELAPLLDAAYPARADGQTLLPFRRIFVVART